MYLKKSIIILFMTFIACGGGSGDQKTAAFDENANDFSSSDLSFLYGKWHVVATGETCDGVVVEKQFVHTLSGEIGLGESLVMTDESGASYIPSYSYQGPIDPKIIPDVIFDINSVSEDIIKYDFLESEPGYADIEIQSNIIPPDGSISCQYVLRGNAKRIEN